MYKRQGYGYASIDGKTYTMVMSKGTVTPPEGGQIDMAGSVFKIGDVTRKPAIADITLSTVSSLTAALSLLDQPPFHFMTKADQPVTLGQGEARIVTQLRLPLQKKIALPDVDYHVPVSYTHLDVYKRQDRPSTMQPAALNSSCKAVKSITSLVQVGVPSPP